MIELTRQPIDVLPLIQHASCPEAGAVVLFLGITRRYTDHRETLQLAYQAYEPMARLDLERLEQQARSQWPLVECLIVHRLGEVPVSQPSVAIVTSSPHRADAFAASQWLIDALKESTPIWKQEQLKSGDRHWVHPGTDLLVDSFGRTHRSLRLSVTDRCNIRCFYCMPAGQVNFRPRDELLTYEEIERFVRVAVSLGIRKVRLTGGEPLVRSDLHDLIARLASIHELQHIALTTNAILLAEQAVPLRAAGLNRLNISLDTLREDVFQQISRREGLDRVTDGIAAAQQAGFQDIRLNAVPIRGLNEDDILPLVHFARQRNLTMRFIEFMPLDADRNWNAHHVLTGQEIRTRIEQRYGPLQPLPRTDPAQPASDYQFADGKGTVGLISPVSQPFCGACDRLRLTAEGQVRNCLFSTVEWDARALLRQGASDDQIRQLLRDCTTAKRAAHGIGEDSFQQPARAMYQIGG